MTGITRRALLRNGAALSAAGLLAPAVMRAQGNHPRYNNALTDLWKARKLLLIEHETPDVLKRAFDAVHEIDHAVDELKAASWFDGRGPDNSPTDARESHSRFRTALSLLQSAHTDCSAMETDTRSAGIRDRALKHIDAATNIVSGVISAKGW